MGDYHRTSRTSNLAQLLPENRTALQEYCLRHNLELSQAAILACCETTSEKKKKALFGGEPRSFTSAVLTQGFLVWAVGSAKKNPVVIHAWFKDIEVRNFGAEFAAKGIQSPLLDDSGVDLLGVSNIDGVPGSVYLALGADAAGEQFIAQLKQGVQTAHLPR